MRPSLSEQLKRIVVLVVVLLSARVTGYIVMGRQAPLEAPAHRPRGARKLVTQVE